MFPLLVVGLELYDVHIAEWSYLHGQAAANQNMLQECRSPVTDSDSAAVDLKPDAEADVDALRSALQRIALPQHQIDKPMLVANGTKDKVVLPQWVTAAV